MTKSSTLKIVHRQISPAEPEVLEDTQNELLKVKEDLLSIIELIDRNLSDSCSQLVDNKNG